MFASPIPPEEQEVIDRYTSEFIENLKTVAERALADLTPARLFWSQGRVTFATNRRTPGGPVDHDLPVLTAKTLDGQVKAILANYACHCTTLQAFNQIHGDWAGVAQELLQADFPSAQALTAIGCGADLNPLPRGTMEHVTAYGAELAREVKRLIDHQQVELTNSLSFRSSYIQLPFEPHLTVEQWEQRALQPEIVGYHARVNLERLARGERLPTHLGYLVQTWNFGDQLAMVFLPGEVVVDYSLRLKREFDSSRLWVSSYANYVPCYIPSLRILREGGYEAESSMWYYDQPARLSEETEELILAAVHRLLPITFLANAKEQQPLQRRSAVQYRSLLDLAEWGLSRPPPYRRDAEKQHRSEGVRPTFLGLLEVPQSDTTNQ